MTDKEILVIKMERNKIAWLKKNEGVNRAISPRVQTAMLNLSSVDSHLSDITISHKQSGCLTEPFSKAMSGTLPTYLFVQVCRDQLMMDGIMTPLEELRNYFFFRIQNK